MTQLTNLQMPNTQELGAKGQKIVSDAGQVLDKTAVKTNELLRGKVFEQFDQLKLQSKEPGKQPAQPQGKKQSLESTMTVTKLGSSLVMATILNRGLLGIPLKIALPMSLLFTSFQAALAAKIAKGDNPITRRVADFSRKLMKVEGKDDPISKELGQAPIWAGVAGAVNVGEFGSSIALAHYLKKNKLIDKLPKWLGQVLHTEQKSVRDMVLDTTSNLKKFFGKNVKPGSKMDIFCRKMDLLQHAVEKGVVSAKAHFGDFALKNPFLLKFADKWVDWLGRNRNWLTLVITLLGGLGFGYMQAVGGAMAGKGAHHLSKSDADDKLKAAIKEKMPKQKPA